jgi:lambda repressor-like predicted transcriptional regulator
VTSALVIEGIKAGKVPGDALACEVGGTAWRAIRSVARFAPAFAKLRIDGPTLVDFGEVDADDPPTLANATLARFEDPEEHTIADATAIMPDDIMPTQRFDEATEVTIVDRAARHSEPPP